MAKYFKNRKIPANVWLGVTVEAKSTKDRINTLRNIPASIRFVSCEPLLEDLGEIDFSNIHWVISGGMDAADIASMEFCYGYCPAVWAMSRSANGKNVWSFAFGGMDAAEKVSMEFAQANSKL